jgi:hypothetical protein
MTEEKAISGPDLTQGVAISREAFKRRRCLVPVDNFYEWKKLGPKEKQPYAIGFGSGGLMALPGWGELEIPRHSESSHPARPWNSAHDDHRGEPGSDDLGTRYLART